MNDQAAQPHPAVVRGDVPQLVQASEVDERRRHLPAPAAKADQSGSAGDELGTGLSSQLGRLGHAAGRGEVGVGQRPVPVREGL